MNYKKLILTGCMVVVPAVFPLISWAADETPQLKQQVEQLQAQVSQLQKQLAEQNKQNPPDFYSPVDDLDPFREMERMQRQMSRMMQNTMMPNINVFQTKMDIKQTDTQYVVTMDLPGMQKEHINVEVKNKMLVVSGDRNSEVEETKGNQFFRKERSFGHFLQSVPLPDDAKSDLIDAQYENGVLKVIIPREKKDIKKVDSRKITIK